MNELVALIGNTCFPVAVAAYLLIRIEKQINKLTSTVNILNTIVSTKLGVVINNDQGNNGAAWKCADNS